MRKRGVMGTLLAAVCTCAPGWAADAPKVAMAVAPEYPDLGNYARISGVVSVAVEADTSGRPVSARITSGHPLLVEAALMAAREWRFAEAGKVKLQFTFSLVAENACTQKVLARFRAPYAVEVAARQARGSCSGCGPEKPIVYEPCE